MKKHALFAFVSAYASLMLSAGQANELSQPVSAKRAIDLTHEMHEGMAFWPGGVPFRMHRLVD